MKMKPTAEKRKVTKRLEKDNQNKTFKTKIQNTKKNLGLLGIITDSRRVKKLGSGDEIHGLKKAQIASCNTVHLKSHLKNVITSTPHLSKFPSNEFNSGASFNNTGSLSPITLQQSIDNQKKNSDNSSEVKKPRTRSSVRLQLNNEQNINQTSARQERRSREGINGDARNITPSVSRSPERKKVKTLDILQKSSSPGSKKSLSFDGLKPEESPKPDFVNRTPRRCRPRSVDNQKPNKSPENAALLSNQKAPCGSTQVQTYSNRRNSQKRVSEVVNRECRILTPLSNNIYSNGVVDDTIVPSQTPVVQNDVDDKVVVVLSQSLTPSRSKPNVISKSHILTKANVSRSEVVQNDTPTKIARFEAERKITPKMAELNNNKRTPKSVVLNATRPEALQSVSPKLGVLDNSKRTNYESMQAKIPNKLERSRSEIGQNPLLIGTNRVTRSEISFVQERVETEPINFIEEILERKQRAKNESSMKTVQSSTRGTNLPENPATFHCLTSSRSKPNVISQSPFIEEILERKERTKKQSSMKTKQSSTRDTNLHEDLATLESQRREVWNTFYEYYEKKSQKDKSPVVLTMSNLSCSNNRRFRNAGSSDTSDSSKDMLYVSHSSFDKKRAQQVPAEDRTANLHNLIEKISVQTQTKTEKPTTKSKIPLFRRSAIRKSKQKASRIGDVNENPTPSISSSTSNACSQDLSNLKDLPNIFDTLDRGNTVDAFDFSDPSIDISLPEKPWRFERETLGNTLDQTSEINLIKVHFGRSSNGLNFENPPRLSGKRVSRKFYARKSLAVKRRAQEENEGLLLKSPRMDRHSCPDIDSTRLSTDSEESDQEKRGLGINSSQRTKSSRNETPKKLVQKDLDLDINSPQRKRSSCKTVFQEKRNSPAHKKSTRNKTPSKSIQEDSDSEVESSQPEKSIRTTSVPEPVNDQHNSEVESSQRKKSARCTPSPEPIHRIRESIESGISPLGSPFQRTSSAEELEIPETQVPSEERSQRLLQPNSSATSSIKAFTRSRKKSRNRTCMPRRKPKKPKSINSNSNEGSTTIIKSDKGRSRSKKTSGIESASGSQKKTSSKKKTLETPYSVDEVADLEVIVEDNSFNSKDDIPSGSASSAVARQKRKTSKSTSVNRNKRTKLDSVTENTRAQTDTVEGANDVEPILEDNSVTQNSSFKNSVQNRRRNITKQMKISKSSHIDTVDVARTELDSVPNNATNKATSTKSKISQVDENVNELEAGLEKLVPEVGGKNNVSQSIRKKNLGTRRLRAEISEVNIVPTEDGQRPRRNRRPVVSRMAFVENVPKSPVPREKSRAPSKARAKRGKKQLASKKIAPEEPHLENPAEEPHEEIPQEEAHEPIPNFIEEIRERKQRAKKESSMKTMQSSTRDTKIAPEEPQEEIPAQEPHEDIPQEEAHETNLPETHLMPPPIRKDLTSDSGFTSIQNVGGCSLKKFGSIDEYSEIPGSSSDFRNLDRLSGRMIGIDSTIQHAFRGSNINENSNLDSSRNQRYNHCINRYFCNPPNNDKYVQVDNFFLCEMIKDSENKFSIGYLRIPRGDRKRTTSGKQFSFVYNVVSGTAHFSLENLKCTANCGDTFCVPRGKKYSIVNVSNQAELLLSYIRIQGSN